MDLTHTKTIAKFICIVYFVLKIYKEENNNNYKITEDNKNRYAGRLHNGILIFYHKCLVNGLRSSENKACINRVSLFKP